MSLINGLLVFPIYLSVNFYSISPTDNTPPLSFLCILETLSIPNFDFYQTVFSSNWQALFLTLLLSLFYLAKPAGTTQLILQQSSSLTHLLAELSVIFLILVVDLLSSKRTQLSSADISCILLVCTGKLLY